MRRKTNFPCRLARLLSAAVVSFALIGTGCPRGIDDEEEAVRPLGDREVTSAILSQRVAVDGCLSRARATNPSLGGSVTIAGTVGTDGRLEEARVSRSSTGDRRLDECVLAETRLARFPEATAPTPFEHEWALGGGTAPRREVRRDEEDTWAAAPAEEARPDAAPRMSPANIREMAAQDAEALNACYANAVQGRPDVQGSIQLSWAIDPSGSVRSAVVTGGTLDDSSVADCLVGRVRSWQFSPTGASGLQQASFTWQFRQDAPPEE